MSGAVEGVALNIGNSDLFRNETTARAKAFVEAMAIVNRDPFVALGILTTPPARSYADGVEFEEAATIADAFAAGQQRMIDEEGPDEACRGGKEVSEFIANAIRRRASIRLLSQGEKA